MFSESEQSDEDSVNVTSPLSSESQEESDREKHLPKTKTKKKNNSAIKRKKDSSSTEKGENEESVPKKRRGRKSKPKLSKDEFKKQVTQKLMLEALESNELIQKVARKQQEFQNSLTNESAAPSSSNR